MPKASKIMPDKNISLLLKGPFGVGKTIAAASFALYGEVYIAYFDKNNPIELFTYFNKIGRKDLLENIEYDIYSSQNANAYLNKLVELSRGCRYSAVITDSVTNLTSAVVNWSMGFRDTKGGKKDKVSGGPSVEPDWTEYKVETSLVTQALDICKLLPAYNIWIAHPLPQMKVEGAAGAVNSVTKTTSIVSYGNKVGAIIPGCFTEIYHFGRQMHKRIVWTDMIGDDYAKSAFQFPEKYFDITDRLFAEVWKEQVNKSLEVYNEQPVINSSDPSSTVLSSTKWKV